MTCFPLCNFAVLITLLLLAQCQKPPYQADVRQLNVSDSVANVTVYTVREKEFECFGTYSGVISPSQEVNLVCYGGGRVEALRTTVGAFVKAGASLAAIDSASAFLLLKTSRMQEKILFKALEQTRKHQKEGNASALAVDQAELAYLQAKKVRIEAEKYYSGALCVTPISGTVTQRNVQLYEEAAPGTHTFTVGQIGTMKITVSIDEADIVFVKPGDTVQVTTPLYPAKKWKGTVKTIAREASVETHTFTTEIHVINTDNLLRPGTSATVRIFLEKRENALLIPDSLIHTSSGMQSFVMIASHDNRAMYREISVCCSNGTLSLVKNGLLSGEKVIIADPAQITSGMSIRITP